MLCIIIHVFAVCFLWISYYRILSENNFHLYFGTCPFEFLALRCLMHTHLPKNIDPSTHCGDGAVSGPVSEWGFACTHVASHGVLVQWTVRWWSYSWAFIYDFPLQKIQGAFSMQFLFVSFLKIFPVVYAPSASFLLRKSWEHLLHSGLSLPSQIEYSSAVKLVFVVGVFLIVLEFHVLLHNHTVESGHQWGLNSRRSFLQGSKYLERLRSSGRDVGWNAGQSF